MNSVAENNLAWAKRMFALTISRSTLQIASLVIIFALGRIDSKMLAMVALGLAFSGIGFALINSIPLGIQPELARKAIACEGRFLRLISALLAAIAVLSTVIATLYIFFAEQLFIQAAEKPHFQGAIEFSKVLAFSIPLVGLTTAFWICIELAGKARAVAKYRAIQAMTQIAAVLLCLRFSSSSGAALVTQVALIYVANDLLFFILIGRIFLRVTNWRRQSFTREELSVLGKISVALTAGAVFDRTKALLITALFATFSAAAIAAYSLGMAIVMLALIPIGGLCAGLAVEVSSGKPITLRRWVLGLGVMGVVGLLVVCAAIGGWPDAFAKSEQVADLLKGSTFWFGLTVLAEGLLMLSLGLSRGLGIYYRSQVSYFVLMGAAIGVLHVIPTNFNQALAVFSITTLVAVGLILSKLYQRTVGGAVSQAAGG